MILRISCGKALSSEQKRALELNLKRKLKSWMKHIKPKKSII
nr:MAG TPA: hypothetical protein [Caudoviricetes sp.]